MCSLSSSLSLSHTHTRRLTYQQKLCKNKHTHRCAHLRHIHMQTLCFWNIMQVPLSLSHPRTTFKLDNVLPLCSAISRLNYSRAEWISKREDKRPSSSLNRFNMFVLFPARLWAGSAGEKYEVIMFRLMERIISCVHFHPPNHSNTSVLTS